MRIRALHKASFIIIIIIIIIRNGGRKADNMITVLLLLHRQPNYGTRVSAQILFYTFLCIIHCVHNKKGLVSEVQHHNPGLARYKLYVYQIATVIQ